MKAVILAGGLGTRLAEETRFIPKPLVPIGGHPILWHIMKLYDAHGINEFVICAGYRGEMIKEYFTQYFTRSGNITVDTSSHEIIVHDTPTEKWKVTIIDTGLNSMTGGRLLAVADYLDDEPFCMTYGDGVGDVDIGKLVAYHKSHGKKATVTAVTPPGRFGVLEIEDRKVLGFREKIMSDQYQINAGFFVLEKSVLEMVEGPSTVWEQGPMEALAKQGELMAYGHTGYWQPMDTLRDKQTLENLWETNAAPWKIW